MPRLCSSLLLSLLIASSASAVTMAWTPIGNPGNACDLYPDDRCFGGIPYTYSVGTYEVTNAQYAEFLNAKAKSDPFGLYDAYMGDPSTDSGVYFGGITRSGNDGSYSYATIAGRENMPVNHVSFFDALRFANWMNNGQGSVGTETGAYTLLGGTDMPSNGTTVTRNPGATIFLTSEDEWYKAAYYDFATLSYFKYPTGSNTQPVCSAPTATTNRANCGDVVDDFTPFGSYPGSPSPYGTFDQAGNISEWTDTLYSFTQFPGFSRVARGGNIWASQLLDTDFYQQAPLVSASGPFHGFRLAMIPGGYIPEPGTGVLVALGLVSFASGRRRR